MLVSRGDPIYPGPVSSTLDYSAVTLALGQPEVVLHEWMDAFAASVLRLPGPVARQSLAATVEPVAEAFASVVARDRDGREPLSLQFVPGAPELREVEKALSFAAANLGAVGLTGFDIGALLFALRDVLCRHLEDQARAQMQRYMEWLAVLAADSLATGREQALIERMHHELDEGTPLIMITNDLPAVLFVGRPDRSVVANVFGRLLLMVVRTGAKAVIIDVRGMSERLDEGFIDPLTRFLGHQRVAQSATVYVCGVHSDDEATWNAIAKASNVRLFIEGYFDVCVRSALNLGGWRLLPTP